MSVDCSVILFYRIKHCKGMVRILPIPRTAICYTEHIILTLGNNKRLSGLELNTLEAKKGLRKSLIQRRGQLHDMKAVCALIYQLVIYTSEIVNVIGFESITTETETSQEEGGLVMTCGFYNTNRVASNHPIPHAEKILGNEKRPMWCQLLTFEKETCSSRNHSTHHSRLHQTIDHWVIILFEIP